MKYSILILALSVYLFAGCGNRTSEKQNQSTHEHSSGTHQHEDGTVHDDHDETNHQQEEFQVSGDSTAVDTTHHSHEDGHQH